MSGAEDTARGRERILEARVGEPPDVAVCWQRAPVTGRERWTRQHIEVTV